VSEPDWQAQIDDLARRVTADRGDLDALGARMDKADARADDIEARVEIDREMIAELHDEGLLSREHIAQLERALKSSRTIGAAIGIIMASRNVGEEEAFTVLKRVSQDSNRKLRDLAHDLVASSDRTDPTP
jgi:hypothetical protein